MVPFAGYKIHPRHLPYSIHLISLPFICQATFSPHESKYTKHLSTISPMSPGIPHTQWLFRPFVPCVQVYNTPINYLAHVSRYKIYLMNLSPICPSIHTPDVSSAIFVYVSFTTNNPTALPFSQPSLSNRCIVLAFFIIYLMYPGIGSTYISNSYRLPERHI